jgi:hypothetical protein
VAADLLTRPATLARLLLSSSDAARALSISPRMLWALTRPRGPIPVIRLGGRGATARALRYDLRDLVAWIDSLKATTEDVATLGDGSLRS